MHLACQMLSVHADCKALAHAWSVLCCCTDTDAAQQEYLQRVCVWVCGCVMDTNCMTCPSLELLFTDALHSTLSMLIVVDDQVVFVIHKDVCVCYRS